MSGAEPTTDWLPHHGRVLKGDYIVTKGLFNSDQPVEAGQDLLGRKNFCEALAGQILLSEGTPGLIFSLEGVWGSGKTSTINMIKGHLQKMEEKPVIVDFNPWMVGQLSSLVNEFFVELASRLAIEDKSRSAQDLSKSLLSYSRLFSLAKFIPGAGPYAETIASVLKSGSEAAEEAAKLVDLNVSSKKRKISTEIINLGRPFVVFVDDLDRLPPDEIYTMIRLVKAVSDFPQVT